MKRKLLALVLSLCLVVSLLPVPARATPDDVIIVAQDITQDTTWENGKIYVILRDEAVRDGGVGSDSAYKNIVEVQKDVTLTIEAGATVLFGVAALQSESNSTTTEKLSEALIVHGTLNATGATITDYYHYYGTFAADSNKMLTYGRFTGFQFLPDYTNGGTVTGSFQNCHFIGGGYTSSGR